MLLLQAVKWKYRFPAFMQRVDYKCDLNAKFLPVFFGLGLSLLVMVQTLRHDTKGCSTNIHVINLLPRVVEQTLRH